MSLLSKIIVRWKEPEDFRVAQNQSNAARLKWWFRPLILFAFTALLMLSWEFARLTPGKHPAAFPLALSMNTGAGVFLIYLIPIILRWFPSTVSLYDKCIMKMGWQTPKTLKFFSSFRWSAESTYYVLELINKKGRSLHFGVPDPIARDRITAVLRQNRLQEISTATSSNTLPPKPDFAARRKAIWGDRVFTAEEVQAMRDVEREGGKG